MDKKEFGLFIAGLRKEKYDPKAGRCWSQKELAEKANLSPRTVGDIERGERIFLDCETIKQLAKGLELTAEKQLQLLKMAACVEYGEEILDQKGFDCPNLSEHI